MSPHVYGHSIDDATDEHPHKLAICRVSKAVCLEASQVFYSQLVLSVDLSWSLDGLYFPSIVSFLQLIGRRNCSYLKAFHVSLENWITRPMQSILGDYKRNKEDLEEDLAKLYCEMDKAKRILLVSGTRLRSMTMVVDECYLQQAQPPSFVSVWTPLCEPGQLHLAIRRWEDSEDHAREMPSAWISQLSWRAPPSSSQADDPDLRSTDLVWPSSYAESGLGRRIAVTCDQLYDFADLPAAQRELDEAYARLEAAVTRHESLIARLQRAAAFLEQDHKEDAPESNYTKSNDTESNGTASNGAESNGTDSNDTQGNETANGDRDRDRDSTAKNNVDADDTSRINSNADDTAKSKISADDAVASHNRNPNLASLQSWWAHYSLTNWESDPAQVWIDVDDAQGLLDELLQMLPVPFPVPVPVPTASTISTSSTASTVSAVSTVSTASTAASSTGSNSVSSTAVHAANGSDTSTVLRDKICKQVFISEKNPVHPGKYAYYDNVKLAALLG